GKQTVTFTDVEFVGYGQPADYEGRDVKNKLVLIVPNLAPVPVGAAPAAARGGGAAAAMTRGAKGVITFVPKPPAPTPAEQALTQAQAELQRAATAVTQAQQALRGRGGAGLRGGGGRGGAPTTPDFTTVQRVDAPVPPALTGDEMFFEGLFGD